MIKLSACVALVFLLYGLEETRACDNHTIANGDVNVTSDTAVYSCNEGYKLNGDGNRSCVNNIWEGNPPTCNIISCNAPVVENGNLSTANVTFNTQVTVTCHTGYRLNGSNNLLCLANGSWNDTFPTCQIINCSSLATPANGTKDTEAISYGTNVTFTCNPGYVLEGHVTVTCQASGSWSGDVPTCKSNQCSTLNSPANGNISTHNFSHGTNVTFNCDDGFELQGIRSVTCQENGSWSGNPPICQIKNCSALRDLPNGSKNTNDISYGTNVTFTCNEGYNLVGATSVICEANGNWSDVTPTCEIKNCDQLDDPENGTKDTSETDYDTTVTFTCDEGFELVGENTTTCLANASWSSDVPICKILECHSLPNPPNGYKNTNTTVFGTTVLFNCEEGYDLNGTNITSCLASMSWSADVPMCHIRHCGQLGALENGRKSTNETTYETTVKFTCNTGYKLADGNSDTITCQSDRSWSGNVPKCNIKTCPPLQKPKNGSVNFTQPNLNYGTMATYKCDRGFELIGDKQIICTDSEQWNRSTTECSIRKCDVMTAPQNGLKHTEAIVYNTIVRFSCNEGYVLTGEEAVRCLQWGNWSSRAPSCQEETSNVAAAVAGTLAALVIIGVIAAVIFLWRRQKMCFSKSWDTSLQRIPNIRTRIGSWRKTLFKPGAVELPMFPSYVESMHRDSNLLFADAFTSLRDNCFKGETKVATKKGNEVKNRYTDVLAYDNSRVRLFQGVDDHEQDYINANYIPGYTSPRSYIATQGPLESTAEDFWRMVWEQHVCTIVMLTRLVEKGMTKCDKYWPDLYESVELGDFVVESKSEKEYDNYIDRLFLITQDDEIRNVRQFAFTTWPDMGCPDDPEILLDFVQTVRTEHNKLTTLVKGPIVVHCSAGVGRTGTFIAVDHLVQLVQNNDSVDIYEMVLEMRRHRCRMVQTEDQFVFIYDCLNAYISNDDEEYAEDDEEEDEIAENGKAEPLYQNATAKEVLYQNTAFQMDE